MVANRKHLAAALACALTLAGRAARADDEAWRSGWSPALSLGADLWRTREGGALRTSPVFVASGGAVWSHGFFRAQLGARVEAGSTTTDFFGPRTGDGRLWLDFAPEVRIGGALGPARVVGVYVSAAPHLGLFEHAGGRFVPGVHLGAGVQPYWNLYLAHRVMRERYVAIFAPFVLLIPGVEFSYDRLEVGGSTVHSMGVSLWWAIL